ncbi:unnamed protein product [Vitrella brassicaformis CCMP3155]|uniref:J domain-containing protein n=1 Tax=Vitrella brassicaformis (strain CCMP3155) TaxID=1169540 RepID=A0A0G4EWI7_VITBC|nr:unnamed protein product [Vitrella brassicaformis CCMP3155]|eukprot:CEM02413.1 unnamed protein product [Vitrella brassicaformis CCMP3155]
MYSYREKNFYEWFEASPTSDRNDIHAAYRKASLKYHPDKNPDPDAEDTFYRLKRAHDILMNESQRSSYHRFGDHNDGQVEDATGMTVVMLSLVNYLLCFILGYVLTFAKPFHFARQIIIVYLVGSFCLELHMRYVEGDAVLDFIPTMSQLLPFEKILLLRQLFPSILCLSIIVSSSIYVDQDAVLQYLLKGILTTNQAIVVKTAELQQNAPAGGLGMSGPLTSTAARKIAAERAGGMQSAAVRSLQEGGRTQSTSIGGEDAQTPTDATNAGGDSSKAAPAGGEGKGNMFREFVNELSDDQRQRLNEILVQTHQQQQQQPKGGGFNIYQLIFVGVIAWIWFSRSSSSTAGGDVP